MTEVPSSGPDFGDPNSLSRFEWEQSTDERVVRVLGEVDLSNARSVLRALEDLGERDLVVDLTEVDFMDSTGLGILVELESHAPRRLDLVVASGSQVDRLLELTDLKRHFEVRLV
jgi:anti-anti-sigma factor